MQLLWQRYRSAGFLHWLTFTFETAYNPPSANPARYYSSEDYLHCISTRSCMPAGWPWWKVCFYIWTIVMCPIDRSTGEDIVDLFVFVFGVNVPIKERLQTWHGTQSRRRRPPWSANRWERHRGPASLLECLGGSTILVEVLYSMFAIQFLVSGWKFCSMYAIQEQRHFHSIFLLGWSWVSEFWALLLSGNTSSILISAFSSHIHVFRKRHG